MSTPPSPSPSPLPPPPLPSVSLAQTASPTPSTRGETSAFRRAEELWEKAAKAREGSRRRSVGATPMLERRLSWRGEKGEEDRRRARPDQRQPGVEREEVRGKTSDEAHDGQGAVARAGSALLDGSRGGAGDVSVASGVSGSAQAGRPVADGTAALQGEAGREGAGGGEGEQGASREGMDRDSVRAKVSRSHVAQLFFAGLPW